jgi:hypothetical protein
MDERSIHTSRLCDRSLLPQSRRVHSRLEINIESENIAGRVIIFIAYQATFPIAIFVVSGGCNDVAEASVFCTVEHCSIHGTGGDRLDPHLASSLRL